MSRKKSDDVMTPANGVPETKAEKFDRLAHSRLDKLEAAAKALAALASKASYDYTTEQAERVIQDSEKAVAAIGEAFRAGKVLKTLVRRW